MKHILLISAGIVTLFFVMFASFGPKSEVVVPEVKPTANYERPVKDGNCWIQSDTAGNKIRVCH